MQINKSFYHDFEITYFKALKRIMAPFKNQKNSAKLLMSHPFTGPHFLNFLGTHLNATIITACKSNSSYEDSNISVVHIETAMENNESVDIDNLVNQPNYALCMVKMDGNLLKLSEDYNCIGDDADKLRYKKYAIVDEETGDYILIITFIFSNGYYLGFNMKRKVTKWEEITTDNVEG